MDVEPDITPKVNCDGDRRTAGKMTQLLLEAKKSCVLLTAGPNQKVLEAHITPVGGPGVPDASRGRDTGKGSFHAMKGCHTVPVMQ